MIATQRILDTLWTLEYNLLPEGLEIVSISQIGTDSDIKYRLDGRSPVVGVWIGPGELAANRQVSEYYEVINPKYIFDYADGNI